MPCPACAGLGDSTDSGFPWSTGTISNSETEHKPQQHPLEATGGYWCLVPPPVLQEASSAGGYPGNSRCCVVPTPILSMGHWRYKLQTLMENLRTCSFKISSWGEWEGGWK